MLRVLAILVLIVATLTTAAAWYMQLDGLTGTGFQVTRSIRFAYAVTDWSVGVQASRRIGRPATSADRWALTE